MSDWSSDVCSSDLQTIAEGIAVKNIGRLTLAVIREHVAELMRVEEAAIERAIGLLASIEKVIAEGAGAVGLAALLTDSARFAGRKVGLVISGGNVDTRLLASVLLRQLVNESRLISLSIDIEDRPGRSEEHTSELQSLMRISYAVFCLKKKN